MGSKWKSSKRQEHQRQKNKEEKIIWDRVSWLQREINNNQTSVFGVGAALAGKQLSAPHCVKRLGESTAAHKENSQRGEGGGKKVFINEAESD